MIAPIEITGLTRTMICTQCGWSGQFGALIAADTLRCPKCKGDEIEYVIHEIPQTRLS